jgi:hypothetical protein
MSMATREKYVVWLGTKARILVRTSARVMESTFKLRCQRVKNCLRAAPVKWAINNRIWSMTDKPLLRKRFSDSSNHKSNRGHYSGSITVARWSCAPENSTDPMSAGRTRFKDGSRTTRCVTDPVSAAIRAFPARATVAAVRSSLYASASRRGAIFAAASDYSGAAAAAMSEFTASREGG